MRFKNIVLVLFGIFLLVGLFIYVEPSVTGLVVQDRFLISDVQVSADSFDQEVKFEQFDDYSIKLDDALYYFTVEVDREVSVNYLLIEFMVDSTQISEDVGLYYYDGSWVELDVEFVKEFGRYNYYEGKGFGFGLFDVGVKGEDKIVVAKNDLLLFGLLPMFGLLLLFISLSFGFVLLVQRFSYRFYLILKKGFVGLVKFGLSFGIVVLILSLVSPKSGDVSNVNLLYYVILPLLVLSLLSNVILNLVLYVRRVVVGGRGYRFVRNSFWLFVSVLVGVFVWFEKSIPSDLSGSLSRGEILLFGLLPLVSVSLFFVLVLYFVIVFVQKVVVRNE